MLRLNDLQNTILFPVITYLFHIAALVIFEGHNLKVTRFEFRNKHFKGVRPSEDIPSSVHENVTCHTD